MKRIVVTTGLLLGILSCAQAAEPVYDVKLQLYRLSSPATGKTQAAKVTLPDNNAGGSASQAMRFSSFAAADLMIGKVAFHMDGKGITWNGSSQLVNRLSNDVECLARPTIRARAGERAQVAVGEEFPVEYMERTAEGHFVRKVQRCNGGLTTDLTVNKDASGNVTVAPLEIQIVSWKGNREAVEGSALDIGKPVLDKAYISMSVTCKLKQPVGIMWTPGCQGPSSQMTVYPSIVPEAPADGGLLMVLTVTEADAQTAKAESNSPQ